MLLTALLDVALLKHSKALYVNAMLTNVILNLFILDVCYNCENVCFNYEKLWLYLLL